MYKLLLIAPMILTIMGVVQLYAVAKLYREYSQRIRYLAPWWETYGYHMELRSRIPWMIITLGAGVIGLVTGVIVLIL